MPALRKKTRIINIGGVKIGGDNKIAIQSMTNKDTSDYIAVIEQIKALAGAGCDIVRVGVLNETAARRLGEIKKRSEIPLVADIHFDYRLALIALEEGVDKLRLNPGNIKSPENIARVAEAASKRKVPIRIGVNSGSAPREILEKYNNVICSDVLVESALWEVRMLEKFGFYDIAVSLKSSSPSATIESYEKFSALCDYPLHLGVTEAGISETGEIRSAIGIGGLLYKGIGDTFRVSLTEDPVLEVIAAYKIKNALRLK